MKILFVSRAYGEQAGGMERLSFELIESVEKLPNVEVEKLVNETEPGKSITWTRLSSAIYSLSIVPAAISHAHKADVVHIGDPVLSLAGWLIQKITKKPVTVTVHGLDVSYSNPLYRLYLNLFFKDLNQYICISEYAKEKLTPWNISDKATVIPPGMKDNYYDQSITRENGQPNLLTTGRLVKRKGHEWFIRNVLPKLSSSIKYIIAGSGPEKEAIEQAITDTHQEDNVKLLGRVSNDQLKKLYSANNIFVQPNISVEHDAEGFGITMLEAALCNREVIASNIDGIPAAIHDGKNGTLLPPEDTDAWVTKLNKLIQKNEPNPSAREYTLDNFSWEKISQRYLMMFKKLTNR